MNQSDFGEYMLLLASISEFIKGMSQVYPNTSHIYLLHLRDLPYPVPFIEIASLMFSVATNDVINDLANQFFQLLNKDSSLLLSILNSMVNLPIRNNTNLRLKLTKLAESAIQSVDEVDLPILIQTLIKSIDNVNAKRTVYIIRKEVLF